MKRIITALGNNTLNNELKKYSKYDVLTEDILYQEGVIDFVSRNEIDSIILSGLLQGELGLADFVKEIKSMCLMARIIVIVDTISEEDKNILISKGVFDILFDEEIEIEDVLDAIDREEPINLRAQLKYEVEQY